MIFPLKFDEFPGEFIKFQRKYYRISIEFLSTFYGNSIEILLVTSLAFSTSVEVEKARLVI